MGVVSDRIVCIYFFIFFAQSFVASFLWQLEQDKFTQWTLLYPFAVHKTPCKRHDCPLHTQCALNDQHHFPG